jgi:hypothetical protein
VLKSRGTGSNTDYALAGNDVTKERPAGCKDEFLSADEREAMEDALSDLRVIEHEIIGKANAVVIGFLVIQSMYTAVTERTREIGILKSLGASKWHIVNVIVRETLMIAAIGVIVGIVISLIARWAMMFEKPVLRLFWSNAWVLRAALIAITGATYPAFKAAQKDPIDALAYE